MGNFVGSTGKIGNDWLAGDVVTGNNFGGVHCHGITGKFGRVSVQCETM